MRETMFARHIIKAGDEVVMIEPGCKPRMVPVLKVGRTLIHAERIRNHPWCECCGSGCSDLPDDVADRIDPGMKP